MKIQFQNQNLISKKKFNFESEHVELLYQNFNIKSHKFSDILIYFS